MKKPILPLLTILLTGLLCAPMATAGELLTNPSFEDAVEKYDKQGWDSRGPKHIDLTQTDDAVDGNYALLVDGRSGPPWEGVKQVVQLKPGKTYRLSGAIKLGAGEKPGKGAVQLLKKLSDGSNAFQDIFRATFNADEYTTFSEEFSFQEDDVKETAISIHGMKDGRSFIVDNFSLEEVN